VLLKLKESELRYKELDNILKDIKNNFFFSDDQFSPELSILNTKHKQSFFITTIVNLLLFFLFSFLYFIFSKKN
jgi:hypothetical protein